MRNYPEVRVWEVARAAPPRSVFGDRRHFGQTFRFKRTALRPSASANLLQWFECGVLPFVVRRRDKDSMGYSVHELLLGADSRSRTPLKRRPFLSDSATRGSSIREGASGCSALVPVRRPHRHRPAGLSRYADSWRRRSVDWTCRTVSETDEVV